MNAIQKQKQEQLKKEAEEWIKAGNPCIYRHGWAWKGAKAKPLTKEEALELLPKYSFGTGFYSLSFHEEDGKVLEFNELSTNDLL